MVPRYKRITDALKAQAASSVNVLDCDGRIYELVPGWLRGGINCMFPIEAASHRPLEAAARTTGTGALLLGGVDKMALIAGREAIDRELEKLHPLVERGGYLPCVDHRVPPDVTLRELPLLPREEEGASSVGRYGLGDRSSRFMMREDEGGRQDAGRRPG
ncbi:MAG: hypothetical protein MZV64_33610 [Ignavibacteriales bacterium]|nr:hypothetical protein [Ignavibacteriales bacterium]